MSGSRETVPDELQVLAGEYVLGVLDAADMRAVRRRAMADPAFAAAIATWERRLTPLAAAVPPLPPPEGLWARIEEAVAPLVDPPGDEAVVSGGLSADRTQSLLPQPARPFAEAPLVERRRAAARAPRPVGWQIATFASLALAAGIAAIALLPRFGPGLGVPPALVAQVSDALAGPGAATRFATLMPPGSHTGGYLVHALPDGTVVLTALASVAVPSGHDLELWLLPPGGTTPAPLGVLPASGRRLMLQSMPATGTQLMVSVEPPGGSPTGKPTGDVVYAGSLAQLSL